MVLVRDRRTKQGEDPVAGRLDDITVVAKRASIISLSAGSMIMLARSVRDHRSATRNG